MPFLFIFIFLTLLQCQGGPINLASESAENQEAGTQAVLKTLLVNQTGSVRFKVETLVNKTESPWGMAFLSVDELIWTEKEGKIKKIHIPTTTITEITGAPTQIYSEGQGGLMDIALHPDFEQNQWIYLTYSTEKEGKQSTALARGKLENSQIKDLKTLFVATPFVFGNRHFGSRLAFDNNGLLFMTMGDRAIKEEAQNLDSHLGKLLRLTEDGLAVESNPFYYTEGAKPEIYTLGHRNPQGLFIQQETNQVWLQEHGPKGGDEINKIVEGKNYGWPIITYGLSYAGSKIGEGVLKQGLEQPVKYFTPSIAPSGLLIYSGKTFPDWKGDFFSGALVLTHLNKLKIQNESVVEEQRMLSSLGLRFRHVIEGPEGFIYACIDHPHRGMILRISPL